MSKKRSKTRLKSIPTTELQRRKPPIDRFSAWLGHRSRAARSVIAITVAMILSIGLTLALYGALLNADPNRLKFGPLNADNLPFILLVFVVVAGAAFYWVGWRVLIGFDFEEQPLEPGRPASLWVLLGLAALLLTLIFGGIQLILALQS
ncbi:MAG: hypothetical protein ACYDBJ_04200 [Aggregatilineales bacterium]